MNLVYKYCDASGVRVLQSLELKVTPPNQFNDPFEFSPRVICSNPSRRAKHLLNNKEQLRKFFEEQKAKGLLRGSFNEFRRVFRQNRPMLKEKVLGQIPVVNETVQRRQLDSSSAHFGVLCLSKRCDSILMWSHYADEHRGCVIGFDSAHEVFQKPSSLKEVKYVKERVVFDSSWLEGDPAMREFATKVVFSKNQDWQYEEEMRQLFLLSSLKRGPIENGRTIFLRPIPAEAVKTVTLGLKCTGELERSIRSVLASPHFSHVKLDRVVLHSSAFALEFAPTLI